MTRAHLTARALMLLALASSAATWVAPAAAQDRREAPSASNVLAPIAIQLDAIPTGSLVVMLLRDIMRVPYVISPDVLKNRDPMSVRLIIPRNQVPERVVGFLRNNGMSVRLDGGTVYVGSSGRVSAPAPRRGSGADPVRLGDYGPEVPSGSPVQLGRADMPVARPEDPPRVAYRYPEDPDGVASAPKGSDAVSEGAAVLAYLPAHRDASYFVQVVGAVVPALKFGAGPEVRPDVATSQVIGAAAPDVLVMSGSSEDLAKARQLVTVLDRPRPMVSVRAVVMSVQSIKARGSALSLLARIGGDRLRLGSFPADAPGSQFVRIGRGALTAVLSAVREDSRFKVVATPNLAALSGGTATMNAGSQVPTVGAVSIAEGGTPVQSIVYRDSGITLTVRPTVRGKLVELDVAEERSTFVRTTTGVEDTPTLQKSSARASVVLKDGESVVLAGLTEESAGNTREGLLGGLLGVRSRDKSDSELLVVLTAEIVPSPDTPPGVFLDIEPPAAPKGAA